MRLTKLRRLLKEDFSSPEQKAFVERFSPIYDELLTELSFILNGNIDDTNLNAETRTFKVSLTSAGIPEQSLVINTGKNGAKGMRVIKAENLDSSTTYPTTAPFITFTSSGTGLYTIKHITGLNATNEWRLTVEIKYA